MPDFLLELVSEEIPARMQTRAAADLAGLLERRLGEARLGHDTVTPIAAPRRIGVLVPGLPAEQASYREERRGPRVDAPAKALNGFLRSVGLASLDQCTTRSDRKGQYYVAVIAHPGRASEDVLAELVQQAVTGLTWPKSMRWGWNALRWVRPLHRIVAVFGDQRLAGGLDLGYSGPDGVREPGLAASAETAVGDFLPFTDHSAGHPVLRPDAIPVTATTYEQRLQAGYVLPRHADREARIADQARALAAREHLSLKEDPGLVAENAGLAEWPTVLAGDIDPAFMDLPDEVLATSMKVNQKYFSLLDGQGRMAPRFLMVAEGAPDDGGTAVIAGNERVLRARLADAKFFWDNDRQTPLVERAQRLDQVIFHARLGSMADKAGRIATLAQTIAGAIDEAQPQAAARAGQLCKADLLSDMVDEFPELQGVMGGYYAREQGEDAAVATAIGHHYAPEGPGDDCPGAPTAVAVAVADKLDTLIGFFAIGAKPTGSKDPYALRRAALGIIRLLTENGVRLPLKQVIAEAPKPVRVDDSGALADELVTFIAERVKVALRDRGVRHDLIDAVFALGGEDDLVRLLRRVAALERLITSEAGADLMRAHRRAANILRAEARKDGAHAPPEPEPGQFATATEQELHDALASARTAAQEALASENFDGAMAALARLRTPVDAFFDHVTVNADQPELRANRLRLLAAIVATLEQVADFARIEG